jgi:hypothetical protein
LESARFIGLDPYAPDFGVPKVLVIGSNTAIGAAVVRLLNATGVPHIPLKSFLDLDFSSAETASLFCNVSLRSAIAILDFPKFHFSSTDGGDWVSAFSFNFTDGLGIFLQSRGIPFIFGIPPPYLASATIGDFCYGAKLVFLPRVVDSEHIYATDNDLLRSTRSCQRSGHSRIELNEDYSVESVSADDAAQFLLSLFDNFNRTRMTLSGSTFLSLKSAIQNVNPSCNLTFVEFPHRLRLAKPSGTRVVVNGSISDMISQFSSFQEIAVEKPYLSIVVTGRHDNYAVGFESRVNTYLRTLAARAAANPTADFEIIFVDYATNTSEFTLLAQALDIPPSLRNRLKFLIVPSSFNDRTLRRLNATSRFLEYVAKNIGVRRSSGDYVLTMNPDSLLSYQFFEAIAGRPFNPGALYLAPRYRFTARLHNAMSLEEAVQLLEEPWSQAAFRLEDFVAVGRNSQLFVRFSRDLGVSPFRAGAGDFIMCSRELFGALWGFHEMQVNTCVDNAFHAKFFRLLPGFLMMYIRFPVMHQEHPALSLALGMVPDLSLILDQCERHGRTGKLPASADTQFWGAPNETFEMLPG